MILELGAIWYNFFGKRLKITLSIFANRHSHTEWRGIVEPFFAEPPTVEHFNLLIDSAP